MSRLPSLPLLALAAVVLLAREAAAGEGCARTRFVAIYDSHGLTPFGDTLDGRLSSCPGAELVSYTLGGAAPNWLIQRPTSPRGYFFDSREHVPLLPRSMLPKRELRTPVLADLLKVPEADYDRQVVILTLGSNVPGAPSTHTAPVESIVRTINARPDAICVWIGPPSIRIWSAAYSDQVYQAIRDGIQAAAAGRSQKGPACHLIDSRKISSYPPTGGDGVHYGFTPSAAAAAQHWAEGAAKEIERIVQDAR